MQSSLLKLAVLLAQPLAGTAANFRPERDGLLREGSHNLLTFNPAVSQTINQTHNLPSDGSFWSSSFVHASNNHSYLVLSHLLSGIAIYRASVLDIADPAHYAQYQVITSPVPPFSPSGVFNASFPDYGFGSTSTADGISELRTWSARPEDGVEFDLTFEISAPILLNGGLGFFESRNNTIYEWGMPAGLTRGWIAWGGAPPGWSWFELHLENPDRDSYDLPMSVWVWEEAGAATGLATIRDGRDVQKVVPVTSLVPSNRTYTSPSSGAVYPLDWTLELGDATRLSISSVRADQEMVAEGGLLPTYEGYVTVCGVYQGDQTVEGYGLVELEIVTSASL
ncbi:kievitone hydratase [Colletotrichum asianum]|uniref:Kievitone hydratase n=1 Tax=Colletotrichum asianum TaxID=702518 RepID=A0A8H3WSV6_9PEZI|nr:kievitone hydratase [Colletotrichum asianum]